MKSTTEFLKEITKVKNTNGTEFTLNQIWNFISDNDLRNNDLLRCVKRICLYGLSNKKHFSNIEFKRFEQLLYKKIDNIEIQYEFFLCLSDLYFELDLYEEAYQMTRGAISSISPDDIDKVYKMRDCFIKQSQILHKNKLNRPKDNVIGFLDLLKSRIYEIIGEINSSLFGYPARIKNIKESFFTNYNYEKELYNSYLNDFNLLDKKNIIEEEILNFINFDILTSMNIFINNENTLTKEHLKNNCKYFEDDLIVYKFCDEIANKYIFIK